MEKPRDFVDTSKIEITFAAIQTADRRMLECVDIARAAAATDSPVLIKGETGVGKTTFARCIHQHSKRRKGPLVRCGSLPEGLLDRELFGDPPGEGKRKGSLDTAAGGTLYLDELSNLSDQVQSKLLGVLASQEMAGPASGKKPSARLVAASHQDVTELVRTGKLRQDLFFRLSEVVIEIPPLRERLDDIPILAQVFISGFNDMFGKKVKNMSEVAMNYLMRYTWPGNVRELKNVIRNGVMNADRESLWLEDLQLNLQAVGGPDASVGDEGNQASLDDVEKVHIRKILGITKGNKKKACELLGISRPTLDRKIKRYEL